MSFDQINYEPLIFAHFKAIMKFKHLLMQTTQGLG